MRSTSRELKLRAKATLKRRLFNLIMIAAVFIVADYMLSYLAGELNGVNAWNRELTRRLNTVTETIAGMTDLAAMEEAVYRVIDSMPAPDFFVKSPLGIVLSVLVSLMSIPLGAGYMSHILQESRGVQTHVGSLISGFRVMGKALAVSLMTWLLVFLGCVFFIIPGIVLALRYGLAILILVDDPSKGPIACMKESGRLMRGNKWRYFKLELSFFFWLLAAGLVSSLIGVPLLNIYLTPYMSLAQAEFYKELAAGTRTSAPSWDPENL